MKFVSFQLNCVLCQIEMKESLASAMQKKRRYPRNKAKNGNCSTCTHTVHRNIYIIKRKQHFVYTNTSDGL